MGTRHDHDRTLRDHGLYRPFFDGTGNNCSLRDQGVFFINLINLPGISLTAGVNEDFMRAFVSFQVGMGFGRDSVSAADRGLLRLYKKSRSGAGRACKFSGP